MGNLVDCPKVVSRATGAVLRARTADTLSVALVVYCGLSLPLYFFCTSVCSGCASAFFVFGFVFAVLGWNVGI